MNPFIKGAVSGEFSLRLKRHVLVFYGNESQWREILKTDDFLVHNG